jgi:hypothetical protein
MAQLRIFILVVFFSAGCKINIQNTSDDNITYRFTNRTNKPLIILLPEAQYSLFNDEFLTKLGKNYFVVTIPVPDENNSVRQIQTDGLNKRKHYYSEAIAHIEEKYHQKTTAIIAEDFNSLIVFDIATAHKIEQTIILNGFYPDLHQALATSYFSQNTTNQQKLISHFRLIDHEEMASLIQHAYRSGPDKQYGVHVSTFWEEAFSLSSSQSMNTYRGRCVWVTTAESGILNTVSEKDNSPEREIKVKLIQQNELYNHPEIIMSN